jgi:hypothetical protein
MKRIIFMMLIATLSLSIQSKAQGNLLITPMRVVFEGNKQKAELNLVNIGTDTATYSVSFKQYNMTEEGMLKLIEKPETTQMFAEPYLRIFPREVTLAPGEAQVIMLQCRRKTDMLAGEYRSHIWFRSEKNYNVLGKKELLLDSNQLSVSIIPIFGITIPVIIRSGEVSVSATLSNLKLDIQQGTIQNLTLTINRTGNISIYGDIIIEYTPVQGKPYEIGTVKGVGVYTNLSKRNIAVKLNNTSGKPLTNGELKVRYVSNGEMKRVVYAEAEVEIKL